MSGCVLNCPSKKTKSTFSVPKDEYRLKVWEENLGIPFKTKSRVCEMHFKSQDILNEWVSGQGLSKYTVRMSDL